MKKLNEKRDEMCVETENADEQKGFVAGFDAAIAEVTPMIREIEKSLQTIKDIARNSKGVEEASLFAIYGECNLQLNSYKNWMGE